MHRVSLALVFITALIAAAWVAVALPSGGTHAAFPGENGRIAFVLHVDGQPQPHIYSANADGSDVRQLTNGPNGDSHPEWSPDGERIAFLRKTVGPGGDWDYDLGVYVMDADGSNVAPLVTGLGHFVPAPHWSPDEQYIAFQAGGVLSLIDVDTSFVETVSLDMDVLSDEITWSPDSAEIAYVTWDEGREIYGIVTVKVDGSGSRWLFDLGDEGVGGYLEWSPDGRHFLMHRPGPEIITVDAVSGVQTRLASGFWPTWSPDGTQIAFLTGTSGTRDPGIAILSLEDGVMRRILTEYGDNTASPTWQPQAKPAVQVEFTQAIQRLQTIGELKSDLQDDGAPPVPIVAGKPAVMRVYFPFVEQTTERTVEVTGEVDETRSITLSPDGGCDAVARRRENAGCRSVDFYFTPPEGAWSVTLTVRDDSGTVLREDEFNLVSEKTDDVLIKAVSVCDSKDASGNWLCQDPFPVMQQVSLMRRMFPTANVRVIVTGDVVPVDENDTLRFPDVIDWWGQVARDLDGLHNETDRLFESIGQETYYYGLVRNEVPGGILGAAYLDTRGAAGRVSDFSEGYDRAPAIFAHEMGHAMGLDHTDTDVPTAAGDPRSGCWLGTRNSLPNYPYQDNMLRSGDGLGDLEVGFDVANGTAIWGDYYFEVMGYCGTPPDNLAPDVTQWITPFSSLELMDPAGPLSVDTAVQRPATASAPTDHWLLQGVLTDPTQVTFHPIIQVTSEGQLEGGAGSHRIEVRGNSGGVLFTRMFTPAHGHGSPSPNQTLISAGQTLSELIPVQAGATSIDVIDPFQTVIGHLDLGGTVPTVNSIELPADFSGKQTVSWSASDPDSTELSFWVAYSPDGGQTWQRQAQGVRDSSLRLDFGTLAGSDGQGMFRVTASDGVNSSQMTSTPFTVASKTPRAEIIGPSETSFREGDLVWLEAAAWDVDDGTLDDGAVTWSSSRDGDLGSGASLPVYDLSVGTHTITMTARDSNNNTATGNITVTVSDAPIVEGEEPGEHRTWGNNNCSTAADPVDALLALRFDAGQNVNTGDCPALGDLVDVEGAQYAWGDVDCSGAINPVDGLKLLRHDSGLSVSHAPGCPEIGTVVTVTQPAALRQAPERDHARTDIRRAGWRRSSET